MLNCTRVADASTAFLSAIGLSLLFAAGEVLPLVMPGFPAGAAWLGELTAAGFLALAVLNWANRQALLGGVYGRPVVLANALFYFTIFMTLTRLVTRGILHGPASLLLIPLALFTLLYASLLFRGPLGNDYDRFRQGT